MDAKQVDDSTAAETPSVVSLRAIAEVKEKTSSGVAYAPRVSQPLEIPDEELNKPHRFWDNQPVPKVSDVPIKCGPIDRTKAVSEISTDPFPLPEGFEWSEIDMMDDEEVKEVYTLLDENYVEDDDSCFRFNYRIECLRWAACPPGYHKNWHVGVRLSSSKKLLGFISGIPGRMQVHDDEILTAEINFLCVHKRLRHKRLAPVLIREITRRVNLQNIWQAVYTAGVFLPRPVAQVQYWHRTMNVQKLVETGFTALRGEMTMNQTIKHYELPKRFTIPGFTKMEQKHVSDIHQLLMEDFRRREVKLYPIFSEEDINHWLLPRKQVIESYVRLDDQERVLDFFSFYSLPSRVIRYNTQYEEINAAYGFYAVARSISMKELLEQALIVAKKNGYDVFNCLDLGENASTFRDLKFGIGDGSLRYYLYNWSCPAICRENVGLILM